VEYKVKFGTGKHSDLANRTGFYGHTPWNGSVRGGDNGGELQIKTEIIFDEML